LKVLFVHDCAHVCQDLARHLNERGVETEFLPLTTFLDAVKKMRKSDADIIHANYIHSPAHAAFLSGKRPYVLMAHGDDIRYGLSFSQRMEISRASLCFHSTPDLDGIIDGSILIPQPVDIERFHPMGEKGNGKKAVYFTQSTSDPRLRANEKEYITRISSYCLEKGYELTIVPSMTHIPYEQMPQFLSNFSLFFDKEFPADAYSKTALECMAMKIAVFDSDSVESNFDYVLRNHAAPVVADKLIDCYESCL